LIAGTAIVVASTVDGVVTAVTPPPAVLSGPKVELALSMSATEPIGAAAITAQAPAARQI
jgi:hypothetical protein